MKNPCNSKNYSAYLSDTVNNDGTIAERVQNILEFGFDHYKSSGDTRYLSGPFNAGFRALRLNDVARYVSSHANLRLVSTGEGKDKVFTFNVNPNSEIKERFIGLPTNEDKSVMTWDQFTPMKINTPFDIESRIKAVIAQCKAAIAGKDGRKLKGSKAHNTEVLKSLEILVA